MQPLARQCTDTADTKTMLVILSTNAAFNATFLGHARMLACVVPAHTTKSHLTCACTHVLLSMPVKTPDRMHHVQLHTRQASENAGIMCQATTRSVQIQSTRAASTPTPPPSTSMEATDDVAPIADDNASSLSSTNQIRNSPMLYKNILTGDFPLQR